MTLPPLTAFGPDFTFAHDDWLAHPAGLGSVPKDVLGTEVAVIGAGAAGIVAAYELMKIGLKPVIYEAARFGGRLRSEVFDGTGFEGRAPVIAEMGGMRFPVSSAGFYHYLDLMGLETRAFPNPLTKAAGSTVVDLEGETIFARELSDLPRLYQEISDAYLRALDEGGAFTELQTAIRAKDAARVKSLWNPIVAAWDERTFYDFVTSSEAFQALSFRHREVFGQVGFGTGGWDSDFPNSMLEILRVNLLGFDDDQRYVVGGVESLLRRLWLAEPPCAHWSEGTSLASLHGGATRSRVTKISRKSTEGSLNICDQWGNEGAYDAVLVTCQSHLLTTAMDVDENLFAQPLWMALDRTRYMQAAKTFVMVDRPFWTDTDPQTGRPVMSMTLTDRITRGTYFFDNGPDQPAAICLSYSWMTDALKLLPLSDEKRVDLALKSLKKIYPNVDVARHIRGVPKCISWEADENFLGAFKGALPGHYRYNHRVYSHFMQQDMPPEQRGIFLAGDSVSWTPAWVEGAVQTGLNAVWGIVAHLGGASDPANPGPGDVYDVQGPVALEG
ncbi:flavin monoamine oxidase family protein [Celeribacter persicus]|uniref:Tryptophan 2-monooxygenase n=1 Tax=Celeribacter persicus TaxID=1651082 RepID=A0A2T5H5F5_9RHOB|nr:NAD(P)/FAD-dependent oxidoreductase [Celeribacter persicus]PTQ66818.1 lysine 2-monooxygenase [Celeribacter persicus]